MNPKEKYLPTEAYISKVHPHYQDRARRTKQLMERAIDYPGELKREWAGSYYLMVGPTLYHLAHDEQETGGWIAGEQGTENYCEPYPTLKALTAALLAGQVEFPQDEE